MTGFYRKKVYVFFAAVTVLLIFLLINYMNILKTTKRTFTELNVSRYIDSSINCFENLKEYLPDISSVNPDWKKSIYFLEVSCRSSKNKKISITPRQACVVESAAFTNPKYDVHLVYASSGVIKSGDTLSDYLLEILSEYKNIKFVHFDIEALITNSTVASLFNEKKIHTAAYPMIVYSDLARFLMLQKYGGVYLDLDVLVLKELDKLPINCAGLESPEDVSNAVIKVAKDSVGEHFTNLCLEDLKNNFDGSDWHLTGPAVMTRALNKMCNVVNGLPIPTGNCSGFTVLPMNAFCPVPWREWKRYFEKPQTKDLFNYILSNSYAIHLWNRFSTEFYASDEPDSIFNLLAEKFCPRVYTASRKYL